MTPHEKALAAAFLAECWKPCREVPRDVRAVQRQADREQQREMELREAETQLPFRGVA